MKLRRTSGKRCGIPARTDSAHQLHVTQPWSTNVVSRALAPHEFVAFDEPDYVKIVWTLRTDAIGANASMFRTETRAAATDATARALMTAYGAPEIVAAAFDLGVVRVVAKPFELRDMTDLVAEAGAAVHPS